MKVEDFIFYNYFISKTYLTTYEKRCIPIIGFSIAFSENSNTCFPGGRDFINT